ncbi:UDP-N-acetylmuramoyl-L-alanine--D-glutamate ligase [Hydromonas duriensis]|uniref:UDP-N-acetylmuramoylalanine--D-glutamate ligase n=1 Tax=Hydromonas duriensis TaxID=1527608 RepID=A0A4R6Y3A1_9BURK|nr:UDP-N-acetylmuramoyl-L-alanine--D-glutamate ligase [Hydromonas duriensis]TDR30835.1 UDP-N-acetylmuramoylalanine--D-glutamate ligase [Hydromonas duriensis]
MSTVQLIIGLGESGLAMVRHAVMRGVPVRVYDSRQAPAQLKTVNDNYPDVKVLCGEFRAEYLDGIGEVAVSPGLSPHAEPLKSILSCASERNIPVVGELIVFTRALVDLKAQSGYAPKVVAVTGTNGKTTVTSLTRHLCQAAGVSAIAAGNISPAMLDALCDAQLAQALPQVWVLELSSFQLQWAQDFNPDAATVLNISQDHLDWHADEAEYVQAKTHIFGDTTVRVLNRDDALTMPMVGVGKPVCTFGVSMPSENGQYGLWLDGAMDWLAVATAVEVDETRKKRGKVEAVEPASLQRLMPADALRIRGRHNAMNALAALALCRAIDLPLAKLLHGLRSYEGEPHRVQWIANINGVDFFDDSKGTNVGATLAALEGLGKTIVLVAGGDGKGQDFSPLFDAVKQHVRVMCLIGKDAQAMKNSLDGACDHITIHQALEEATQHAAEQAQANEAVLLSPACASLDMFKNYAHRAEVFVAAVQAWAHENGQV